MSIVGLDVSTSVIGIAVLDDDGNILHVSSIDLKNKNKYPDIFSKIEKVRSAFGDLKTIYSPTMVAIESAVTKFQAGKSSAFTIASLLTFNGMVSLVCYDIFKSKPLPITSGSARSICGIKIKKGEKAKVMVMKFMINTEPVFASKIVRTNRGNIKPSLYDEADALVVAKALFKKHVKQ